MKRLPLTRRLPGGVLLAVPAIHYRAAFAARVNALCRELATRPRAIAVELSPGALDAVKAWLAELGSSTGTSKPLPCLLGLAGIVRASITEGDETSAGSLDLLPLSPSDSIIEAVRSALELDIPVYGIDLDSPARRTSVGILIPDPEMAWAGIEQYVAHNAGYADSGRDSPVDSAREVHMAASLKALVRRHRKVLFTGGLGHWARLTALLQKPRVVAALPQHVNSAATFQRVIIHPTQAIGFMDTYPIITWRYSQRRSSPAAGPADAVSFLASTAFRRLLSSCYANYFGTEEKGGALDSRLMDLQLRDGFEQYTANLCALHYVTVPPLGLLLTAAKSMMSKEFVRVLTRKVMDIPWASPKEFPALPVMVKSAEEPGGVWELSYADGHRRRLLCDDGMTGRRPAESPQMAWCWPDEPGRKTHGLRYLDGVVPRTWPAADCLLSVIGHRAAELASQRGHERDPQPLTGSLLDGIDIRATIRSRVKGESRIYVNDSRRRGAGVGPQKRVFDPTVFILQGGQLASSDWVVHNGHYSILEPFVRDTRRLAAEVRKYGEYVVDAISFSQSLPVADDLRRADIALRRLHGTLILSQAHFNSIQEARWLEDTGYHYMPFFDGFGTRSFFAMLRERHGLELDWQDWTSALVHMAIPFAESRVIVVAPDNHAISPEVLAAGQARGVEIAAIPLSCFPAEQLRRLSHQHFVRPVDNTGQRFPKYAEQAIGESQDLNRELVPPHLLNYGLN